MITRKQKHPIEKYLIKHTQFLDKVSMLLVTGFVRMDKKLQKEGVWK